MMTFGSFSGVAGGIPDVTEEWMYSKNIEIHRDAIVTSNPTQKNNTHTHTQIDVDTENFHSVDQFFSSFFLILALFKPIHFCFLSPLPLTLKAIATTNLHGSVIY